MSEILDALRELDRKKSSHWGRETNIFGKFPISDTPRRKKRTHLYLVAVLLTPVAAASITYANSKARFSDKIINSCDC